ncbi:MAG: REP element-mobilizing transposase RayT [Rhodothermales bacterium]|jgi:REP element-mobilizing transposase RayT
MYNCRSLTEEQRSELLEYRHHQWQPWHGPPTAFQRNWFHISATCYEHQHLIGQSPARMARFTGELQRTARSCFGEVSAWCVLPNHHHLRVQCFDVEETRKRLGRLSRHHLQALES